ncbi:MAG: hypothetical protein JSV88_02170, partial [Candidatus Aminicenantes bacterium]
LNVPFLKSKKGPVPYNITFSVKSHHLYDENNMRSFSLFLQLSLLSLLFTANGEFFLLTYLVFLCIILLDTLTYYVYKNVRLK